jgi:hypothetical protein
MAASADVSLVNPIATGESITQAVAPSDTLAGARDSDDASDPGRGAMTHEDGAGDEQDEQDETQGLDQPPQSARTNSPAETADEPFEPSASQDSSATVTESGELRIITTSKGLTSSAALFIDGKAHGNTPLSLQLPVGKHTVRVEKNGQRHERNAVVKSNEVTLVRVEFAPK